MADPPLMGWIGHPNEDGGGGPRATPYGLGVAPSHPQMGVV